MTVIDEVLAAEKASEQKVAEARDAAVISVVAARKEQQAAIDAEKMRLAQVEDKELSAHAEKIAKEATKIVENAYAQVKAVETKFEQKSSEISKKITAVLS